MYVYACTWGYVHVNAGALGGQKRGLDSLLLELDVLPDEGAVN